jgi:hypothetical protein
LAKNAIKLSLIDRLYEKWPGTSDKKGEKERDFPVPLL